MSEMLSELMWQSALLVGSGMLAGLVIGFLLYPKLFRQPSGCHRKGGVTTSRGHAPAPTRPSPVPAPNRPLPRGVEALPERWDTRSRW
jgi:hypothetical protein